MVFWIINQDCLCNCILLFIITAIDLLLVLVFVHITMVHRIKIQFTMVPWPLKKVPWYFGVVLFMEQCTMVYCGTVYHGKKYCPKIPWYTMVQCTMVQRTMAYHGTAYHGIPWHTMLPWYFGSVLFTMVKWTMVYHRKKVEWYFGAVLFTMV